MDDDRAVPLWALPPLTPRDLRQVGGGAAQSGALLAWIDIGERLEVAGYLPMPGSTAHLLIDSAAGAAALDAVEPDEAAMLDLLQRRHGRVAAGELLCAQGLVMFYRGVCRLRGVPAQRLSPGQVSAKALQARCPECSRALSLFCALLGDVAARTALTLGARGGVCISGRLVAEWGEWFSRSPFRRRFEACGSDRALLRAIPTWLVHGPALPSRAGARPIAMADDTH